MEQRMHRVRVLVGWCAFIFCIGAGGRLAAAPILSLSSPSDLQNLTVGQAFTVGVSLSGLAPDQELVSLTSSVTFPPALLGTPSSTQAGTIISDPLDLLTVDVPGLADAAFIPRGDNRITADGTFYTFTLTAQAPGAGVIDFDTNALLAEQLNPGGPPLLLEIGNGLLAGEGLPFSINIPEPGLVSGGALFVLLCSARRRKT